MFYKRGKKLLLFILRKTVQRFQDNYLELETIIEPMFNSELVEKSILVVI